MEQVAVANPVAPIARTGIASETATASRWRYRARTLAAHAGAMLLFATLTLTLAPHVALQPTRTIVPDLIDPVHHIWSIAVLLHQITAGHDGLWSVFDGNIFYPTPHSASYADTFLGLLPVIWPLSLLVHDPTVLTNLTAALSFVLSAYGAFLLGREVTGQYSAGVVAGVVFGFCPLHMEQIGHLTLASMQWQALAAYCLVRAWRRSGRAWWFAAGVLLGLSAAANLYYLAYLTVPLLLTALTLGRDWTRQKLYRAAMAGAIAVLIAAPVVIPYLVRQAAVDARYGGATATDALNFLHVLSGRPLDSMLLPVVPFGVMQTGHGFFPGIIPLGLALVAWRNHHARRWIFFAACSGLLALGPSLDVGGHILPFPLPYAVLSNLIPHFALFRDPTRALAGFYLGMAVSAAWGARDLLGQIHGPRRRTLLGVSIVALTALELWTPLPVAALAQIPNGEYWLARHPAIGPIVEIPIANDTPQDWQRQAEIMRDSTVHWNPMVNGSASVDPTGLAARRAILGAYPSTDAMLLLRQLRVDAVVLRLAWLTPAQRRQAQAACHVAYRDSVEVICLGPWAPVRTAWAGR